MALRWSQGKTLKFVLLYRDYENLWNVYHPGYRDRSSRLASMRAIVEEMNLPNFTIKDVPKKIKALRSTYHLELAKVEKSRVNSEGTVYKYKPSLLWFDAMAYIIESAHFKEEDSDSSQPSKMPSQSRSSCGVTEQGMADDSTDEQQSSSNPRVFFYGDVNQVSSSSRRPNVIRTFHSGDDRRRPDVLSRGNHHLKRKIIVTTSDVVRELRDLKAQVNSSCSSRKEEDECDIMGKHIAFQLRELPVQERVRVNFEIQKILMDYRLKNMESLSASHSPELETFSHEA